MAQNADPSESPVFHPQTWRDMLETAKAKRDIFSTKTLQVILDGVEQLALVRMEPDCPFKLTGVHATAFEKLQRAYNNGGLLKAVGALYLNEFQLPGIALKHLELARQFAPNDGEIEQLQLQATAALGRQANGAAETIVPADLGVLQKPNIGKVVFVTTTKLHRVDAGMQLNASTGELERRQEARRKTQVLAGFNTQKLQDFTRALAQIQGFIETARFTDAFSALSDVVRSGAPVEDAQICYAQLGLAAFEHNRLADALAAYLKMREMAPESVEGWYNCGLVYHKMGMADEALDCYEEASRLDPGNPRTWCNLASIWFDRGDYAEAEKMSRKALELRADYPRALDNLAATLSAMDRLPEAAEVCQHAIRVQPNLHSAWFKLGVIKFQQEQFVPAMEAFHLTGDNPDFFPYVLYYLCMIDARRGRIDDAIQKLGDARAADPENELESLALKEIGALCTKLEHHQAAADAYGQICTIHPEDTSAWLAKGTAYYCLGQFEEAREAYARVSEIEPANPVSWHNLGTLAAQLGRDTEARDCFQRETELSPEDPKAWHDLASAWQKLGKVAEATQAFDRADQLVRSTQRKTSDLSAAMSIVRRLNLGDRVLKTGPARGK